MPKKPLDRRALLIQPALTQGCDALLDALQRCSLGVVAVITGRSLAAERIHIHQGDHQHLPQQVAVVQVLHIKGRASRRLATVSKADQTRWLLLLSFPALATGQGVIHLSGQQLGGAPVPRSQALEWRVGEGACCLGKAPAGAVVALAMRAATGAMAAGADAADPIHLLLRGALEQVGRLQLAFAGICSLQNAAGWIQPNRLPTLLVVGIALGVAVVGHRPDDGVILVGELFKPVGQGLIREFLGIGFVG